MSDNPVIRWNEAGEEKSARWRSESGTPPPKRVVIADDLIATGGTAVAATELVSKLGATVVECAFVIELAFLKGREKLKPHGVFSILQYDSE